MTKCPCCKSKLLNEDGWLICRFCGWEKDLANAILKLVHALP